MGSVVLQARVTKAFALALGVGLVFAACDTDPPANTADLLHVNEVKPDKIIVYSNVDMHPNVAILCLKGVGWVTTTRDNEALKRVPEYDKTVCATP